MSEFPQNVYANPSALPPISPAQEKQYALLTHLLSAFFGFIPALIFFVLFKDRGPFVREHVVTEWNFQLTLLIADGVAMHIALSGWVSMFVMTATGYGPPAIAGPPPGIILFLVGYLLIVAIGVVRLVFCIIASVASHRGRFYRYPIAIRFIRA